MTLDVLNARRRITETACWEWTGPLTRDGYGRVWVNGRREQVHRYSYELLVGPIPEGLQLDHLCRNRACFNPTHLEPVTLPENLRRGDGICARNARKTHCKHGHAFDAANTIVRPTGRDCRACAKARMDRFITRRNAKGPAARTADPR